MAAQIVTFPLPLPVAEQLIRQLTAQGRLVIEPHFREGMHDRDFTMRQVLETLKCGVINQGPALDDYNEWRCRVKRRVAGRLVRVVVAISKDQSSLYLVSVH